jgi:hypothetical protein
MQRMANQVSKTACAAWALSHKEAELSQVQQQRDYLTTKSNSRPDAHHEPHLGMKQMKVRHID